MSSDVVSLRSVIDKWLAPSATAPIRVTRLRCASNGSMRCVRAEPFLSPGSRAIFFFRHGDGSWRVFPPDSYRPTMGVSPRAA